MVQQLKHHLLSSNWSKLLNCNLNLLLGSIFLVYLSLCRPAQAQVTEDGTLPTNITTRDNRNFTINDGKQAGNNLFHSFEQFSVPSNGSVLFNNSTGIQNIISRVTGGSLSDIDGLIKNNGDANLFLLNPKGIIFGNNAVLDLGGSFIASTAESLIFADGNEFSTKDPTAPLLTISTPLGLQFGDRPGKIINRSQLLNPDPLDLTGKSQTNIGLTVLPKQTLALLGGDILIDGGALTAPIGNIELGSVGANSLVRLNPTAQGWKVNYQDVNQFKNLQLDNLAIVNASGEGGGAINLQARQIKILNGSAVVSETFGAVDGDSITVNASEFVELKGSDPTQENVDLEFIEIGIFLPVASRLASNTFGLGKGGDITIETPKLLLLDGAKIETQTIDNSDNATLKIGDSGNVAINATDLVELNGTRPFLKIADNAADLIPLPANGEVAVNLERFMQFSRSSSIDASSVSNGKSGNISIMTDKLSLLGGTAIQNIPFSSGDGGAILINAQSSITITGDPQRGGNSASLIASTAFGEGNAGNIDLTTTQLSLHDGGGISTSTLGSGNGADIILNATEIKIFGTSASGEIASGFGSRTFSSGNAGNVIVDTEILNVQDRGQITVSGTSSGSPGNLNISADSIQLSDRATIAAATASGSGGNIKLDIADNLVLRRNSLVSAQASDHADGGNVEIDANFIIARPNENSDILASAVEGNGGNINLNTQGIFGISERDSQPDNLTNDLDASSVLGVSGTVAVQISQFDASQGIFEIAPEIIDLNFLLQNSFCEVSDNSSYIITGRGGIPLVPEKDALGENTWEDWRVIEKEDRHTGQLKDEDLGRKDREILPIQGWLVNRQGKVVLTANPLTVSPHSPVFHSPDCHK